MVSITIIGRLTRDGELKYTASGDPIMNFSVATDRRAKKGNEWVKEPSFWNCTLWGKRAESLQQYMTKGTQVAVTGEAYEDSWEKDNVKHTRVKVNAHEIMLLGGKPQQASQQSTPPAEKPRGDIGYGTTPASQQAKPAGDFQEDIPF
jgi:single-strand DNA-binding protein